MLGAAYFCLIEKTEKAMTIEELSQQNEAHHGELKLLIDNLRKDVDLIPIYLKEDDEEPVMFNRVNFHQKTYDTIHFKGIGGKFIKAIAALSLIVQLIILLKVLWK